MRGKPFLAVGAFLAASCSPSDPPGLKACEEALLAQLKAPATYQRASDLEISPTSYLIEFDSQNSFGALIRGKASCDVSDDGNAEVFIYPT